MVDTRENMQWQLLVGNGVRTGSPGHYQPVNVNASGCPRQARFPTVLGAFRIGVFGGHEIACPRSIATLTTGYQLDEYKPVKSLAFTIRQEQYGCELFTYRFHMHLLVSGDRDATTFHSQQESVEPENEPAVSRLAIPPWDGARVIASARDERAQGVGHCGECERSRPGTHRQRISA